MSSDGPGVRPIEVLQDLDDAVAAALLPAGAHHLTTILQPELLKTERRAEILASLLSLEIAVDDPIRRRILLDALPAAKHAELEARTGQPIASLGTNRLLDTSVRRSLLGFFGYSTVVESVPTETESPRLVSPRHALFPHQQRAAASVEQFLFRDTGRAMLHLPTGVGKTRTAMSVVASHLRTRPGLVVWLASTRELLEQAALEFEETWESTGDRQLKCTRFWSSFSPDLHVEDDGLIVAGLAKLHSYGNDRDALWALGDKTTMVVFDEAHQAVAATYRDLVETLATRNPRTPLLGLSATPGRTWGDPEQDAEVAELFHSNKVTLDFGDGNPIRHLTEEGYLAKVTFSLLNVEPGLDLTDEDLRELDSALDLPDRLLLALGDDTQRNLRIVQRLVELKENHRRILVFAASVSNAQLLSSVCRSVGIDSDVIVGTTDSSERERSIARFKRPGGRPRILINYGVLTTGFDAPAASAALIVRPTQSLVLYSQMVGRVIRGPKAGGTEHCEVITVVDTNLPGFGDVAEAFTNWEDVWTT